MVLRTNDRWLEAGETVSLDFKLAESATLEGWQLALEADPSRLEIEGLEGLPQDHFSLKGPELRAVWADGNGQFFDAERLVFQLKVKALQATRISEGLSVRPEKLRPEAYVSTVNSRLDRQPLLLHFGEQSAASSIFFPPHPNPFATETSFEILTENPASALLEVFDLNGRRLVAETYALETGLQTLRLRASSLQNKGVFIYQITVGEEVSKGRLVRI